MTIEEAIHHLKKACAGAGAELYRVEIDASGTFNLDGTVAGVNLSMPEWLWKKLFPRASTTMKELQE